MNFLKKTTVMLAFIVTSCATIFSGTTQTINIKAIDIDTNEILLNTRCTVIDGTGSSHVVISNPGQVTVSKARGNISVNCIKKDFVQVNTAVGDSFNSVTLVNILFWPGFIVDAMTGAYKDLPSHFVVSMKKNY